jgi:cytochrome c553
MKCALAMALISVGLIAGAQVFAQPSKSKNASTTEQVNYAQKFQAECAPCHGTNGSSDIEGVPVLAGQHSFYAITQLFLFREKRRSNLVMTSLASRMNDSDLRGFSDYIDTLPTVTKAPDSNPLDAQRMQLGKKLAREYKCSICHGEDMSGGQQVPSLRGQKEAYLLESLKGLKIGTRPAYTRAMTETLSQVPSEDFNVLAYYISNIDRHSD